MVRPQLSVGQRAGLAPAMPSHIEMRGRQVRAWLPCMLAMYAHPAASAKGRDWAQVRSDDRRLQIDRMR
jgi:hypothetical protein